MFFMKAFAESGWSNGSQGSHSGAKSAFAGQATGTTGGASGTGKSAFAGQATGTATTGRAVKRSVKQLGR